MNLSDTAPLIDERDRLHGKLTRLWNWLMANEGHEEFERREQVWMGALKKYTDTCDQLE